MITPAEVIRNHLEGHHESYKDEILLKVEEFLKQFYCGEMVTYDLSLDFSLEDIANFGPGTFLECQMELLKAGWISTVISIMLRDNHTGLPFYSKGFQIAAAKPLQQVYEEASV